MLSAADSDLCLRDPELPGLGLALDPSALAERLAADGFALSVGALAPLTVRYAPGDSVLVSLGDASAAAPVPLGYLHAWAKTAPKKLTDHPDVHVLADEQLAVCRWPDDLRLKTLRNLGSKERSQRLLAALGVDTATEARVRVLSYRPERRSALALDGPQPSVIKLYRGSGYRSSLQRWRWLEQHAPVATSRLAAHSDRHNAIRLSWQDGQTLAARMRDGTATVSESNLAGGQLARLHACPAASLPGTDGNRLIDGAHKIIDALATLLPDRKSATQDLATRAAAQLQQDSARIIHGDFHAKQVLLTNDGSPSMLDLDDVVVGAPLEDLASFGAHLLRDAAMGAISATAARQHIDAFRSGYGESSAPADDRQWSAGMALALVQMAAYPFRNRHPDWPTVMRQILDDAAALLPN